MGKSLILECLCGARFTDYTNAFSFVKVADRLDGNYYTPHCCVEHRERRFAKRNRANLRGDAGLLKVERRK